jgi:hypothetical protein
MRVTTQQDFEPLSDDYIIAITTPDTGNGESEAAMRAVATKYGVEVPRGGSVLAAMFRAVAQGTLQTA